METAEREGYAVATAEWSDGATRYVAREGLGLEETSVATDARLFESYAEASRHMLANCEIEQKEPPIAEGEERPAYPRVCYLRLYARITRL